MAANRRRRRTSSKNKSGTVALRKQRTLKKVTEKPVKKKSPQKKNVAKRTKKRKSAKPVDWKVGVQKWAIIFFFIADILLIYFFIKHCSVAPVEDVPLVEDIPVQQTVRKTLQIEVLNGCAVGGLAAKFTDYLRDKGFDVVKTDNYMENGKKNFRMEHTVVIDRRGEMENARRVADILKLPAARVLSEPNKTYLIDATVVLGLDYSNMAIWKVLEQKYD